MKMVKRRTLPFVAINVAMTADGKLTTANRSAAGFGSRRDQIHMLELRARADAVMSGARTVDAGDVKLGPGSQRFRRLRRKRGLAEYNLRIIASRTASIDPKAAIFRARFSPIIILTTEAAPVRRIAQLRKVADEVKVFGGDAIDWHEALAWLRDAHGVEHLLCEGGGELNDALFRAGVVHELHLTICPRIFGGRGAPTLADGKGAPSLPEATRLRLKSWRRHGDELFTVYGVENASEP
jgi:riboflavin-specific deaminase-like protein